ncbi:Transposase IS4 [Popillia japonica]|uniref:Transposase IS4 n=1 Tax=Popillia japonica TaxID=7064 RepID=A0AAW1JK60_POPJA
MGILLFSGYHNVPQATLYWSLDAAFGIPMIRQTMSRNMFTKLKANFHIANNDKVDISDKFAKVRPLFDMLNKRYIQFGVFAEHLSIDETMVPTSAAIQRKCLYVGSQSVSDINFIRGKPIRFGYKLWTLCSSNGYMFQFIPYSGASGIYHKRGGLGASVIMQLLSHCEHPMQHTVHFDNFFTSHYLPCLLKERGFCATGTVRPNRVAGALLQTWKKALKKHLKERGFCATGTVRPNRVAGALLQTWKKALKKHDTDYVYDTKNDVMVIRWMDNSEVTIATNYDTIEPMVTVQRFSKEKKKKVGVPQPFAFNNYNRYMGGVDLHDNGVATARIAFNNYNRYMGGVDLHDNGVANYRIGIRGKKWWWPLWVQCLDSAVVNAWKLHCIVAAWWPLWVQCLDSAVVNAWKLHCIVAASKKTKPMVAAMGPMFG